MSDKPPEEEEIPREPKEEPQTPSEDNRKEKQIVILGERDIPFEEERPPNFSQHFSVTVHAFQKKSKREEHKE